MKKRIKILYNNDIIENLKYLFKFFVNDVAISNLL